MRALVAALLVGVAGPAAAQAPPAGEPASLSLSAVHAGTRAPIPTGLVWRVFEDKGTDTRPTLVAKSEEPSPTLSLPPGTYTVHAAYGYAGTSRRVTLAGGRTQEQVEISAGALTVVGVLGGAPIQHARLAFSVYVPVGTNLEGRLIRANIRSGEVVRLPEGTYHVVSTYGESNSITRADLKVEAGKLVEATLNHRAATVTFKLVGKPGGEAIAGTAFTVLTPGGDVIREVFGALPSTILAEGEYIVDARQFREDAAGAYKPREFGRTEFKVETGYDRDVEIVPQR